MTGSAIVTGGASGLGRATSAELVRRGLEVVIADRNTELGKRTAEEIGAHFMATDVTDEDSVAAAVEAAVIAAPLRAGGRELRGGDMVAAVAGPCRNAAASEHLHRRRADQPDRHVPADALGGGGEAASDPDVDGERGVIVNTASIAAFDGQSGQLAYAASKAGVVGMTLPAARDLSPVGIRVCAIAPGVIETPMVAGLDEKNRTELKRIIQQPKRPGRPEEFAALVGHIIDNAYLNGEVIRLDGGLRMPPR
jgi:NAD(P)-dependent dehydrogenase (short-subunit alcohol dehydrogenase family)